MRKNGEARDSAAPAPIAEENTGRISRRLHAELASAAGSADVASSMTPGQIIEAIAAKVHEKGNGGGGPPRFLGLDRGSWTKMILGWLVLLVGTGAVWWLYIHDAIRDRPTRTENRETITEAIVKALEVHGMVPHTPTEKRLRAVETEQRTIRESQIRSEQLNRQQTDTLKEISSDIKRLRRRR